MHKGIILLLTLMMTLGAFAETKNAKPKGNELSFARHFAEDYLSDRGARDMGMDLVLEEYTDRLFFFNDMRHHLFILMVRDEYAELLADRVLAFSIGVPHTKARETETFITLFEYYDKLVSDIYEGKIPPEKDTDMEKGLRYPLLFNVRWRQFGLSNVYEGQRGTVISGCGPVAVGELMGYYCWPKTVTGNFSYKDDNGEQRSIEMDGKRIEWSSIQNFYIYNDPRAASLAPLMKMVGVALKANYGKEKTSSSLAYAKRAMTMNFGYSPAMFFVTSRDVSETDMVRLIRNDLKKKRPCILTGGHHVFVCDGYYDDFLHLNMGWSGSYDGWYRFPAVRKEGVSDDSFIQTALLNIMPQTEEEKSKDVTLEKPGTLASLLSEEDCASVSELTVHGKINGADIRLIRRMAGALEPDEYWGWKGVLKKLDLSDAEIIKDSAYYTVKDARKYGYRTKIGGEMIGFRDITEEQWEKVCKEGADKSRRYDFVRSGNDYMVHIKTLRDDIGTYMFEDCENLQSIALPRNIVWIEPYAFANCRCLKSITLPSMIQLRRSGKEANVSLSCFEGCMSLETVKVCSDSPLLNSPLEKDHHSKYGYFRDMHPNFHLEADSTLESYAATIERYRERFRNEYGVSEGVADKPSQSASKSSSKGKKGSVAIGPPMGSKVIKHYKIVKGKKKLIGVDVIESQ